MDIEVFIQVGDRRVTDRGGIKWKRSTMHRQLVTCTTHDTRGAVDEALSQTRKALLEMVRRYQDPSDVSRALGEFVEELKASIKRRS